MKNACDRPELVQKIVDEWRRLTPGKRTIAFCVDVEHARHVAEAFQASGIPAATVEGGTPIKERKRLYEDLGAGRLLMLSSCNVISIGFDEPSVEVGLLLRPTQSKALHYQQIGRVMRISPATGKTHGIILDQAGNLQRLGFPEDIKHYRLPTSKDPQGSGALPTKQCPDCNRLVWAFVVECPECRYQWPVEQKIQTEDLIELSSQEQFRQFTEETMIQIFRAQRRKIFEDGQTPTLARRLFFQQVGRWPNEAWYQSAIFGQTPTLDDKRAYRDYLVAVAQQHGRSLSWVMREFEKEFGPNHWQDVFMNA